MMTLEWNHCLVNTDLTVWVVHGLELVLEVVDYRIHFLQPAVAFLSSRWKQIVVREMEVAGNLLKLVLRNPIGNRCIVDVLVCGLE